MRTLRAMAVAVELAELFGTWLMDTYQDLTMFFDLHSYAGDVLYNWVTTTIRASTKAVTFLNSAYDGQRGILNSSYGEFLSQSDELIARGAADAMRDAMDAARGRSYVAKQSVGLYPTAGASDDYAFSRHLAKPGLGKIYGFTLELISRATVGRLIRRLIRS